MSAERCKTSELPHKKTALGKNLYILTSELENGSVCLNNLQKCYVTMEILLIKFIGLIFSNSCIPKLLYKAIHITQARCVFLLILCTDQKMKPLYSSPSYAVACFRVF